MKYKILKVSELQKTTTKDGKEFQKIGFYAEEVKDQYPKKVYFESGKEDMIKAIQNLKVGEVITPSFNIESKEYNGKYYTTVIIWKFEKEGITNEPVNTVSNVANNDNEGDNLPF